MVEEMRATILDLQNSNDSLKKEVQEAKRREECLRDQVAEANGIADAARRKADDLDQYIRRNNLRIYGLPETGEEDEGEIDDDDNNNNGACEKKVLDLIQNKLQLKDVGHSDIEAAHRLGKKRTGSSAPIGPRGVIVRFVSRKTRDAVLHNRRRLKGSRQVVVEDLSQYNYYLLNKVRSDDLCKAAWTKNDCILN
nr:hypothetical protein BaRGS_002806 [Batillaria attramentaria]